MSNLKRYEDHLLRAQVAPATRDQYLGIAESYWRFCKARDFDSAKEAVSAFLSTYPTRNLSIASQRLALNVLAGKKNGFYAALGKPIGKLPAWVKATKPITVPSWVTQSEAERICENLEDQWSLMVRLMFGAGLRVSEVTSLRWRDLDFERLTITVKQSKGKKDRITFLPSSVVEDFREQYRKARMLWRRDRSDGRPGVEIPRSIANKSPKAGEDWALFWVFPSAGESCCPETKIRRRHHIHQKSLAKPVRKATQRAGIAKRVTAHAFRHGFATAYLMAGGNLRELRDLMGHKSIETTEIYLHCLPSFTDRVGSPLDRESGNVVPFVNRPGEREERKVFGG
jgi:integrase